MGEMADAIIEGECCQQCGQFFDDEAPGHPRTCSGCGGMDDESDEWGTRERKDRAAKRKSNQEWSTAELKRCGFRIQVFNGGVHIRVEKDVDFWPSTGLWMHKGEKRRGIKELVKFLQNRNQGASNGGAEKSEKDSANSQR